MFPIPIPIISMRGFAQVLLCAAAIASSNSLKAQTISDGHTSQYERWALYCKKQYGNRINDCVAKQSTLLRGDSSVWLDLYFEHAPEGELNVRVFTPSGVEIDSGVPIIFANHQPDALRFKKCTDKACVAIGRMSAVEKALLLAAEALRVFIVIDEDRVIELPISVAGLGDALDDAANRIFRTQTMLSATKHAPSVEKIEVNLMLQSQSRHRPAIMEMYQRASAANLGSPDECSASLIVLVNNGKLEFGADKDSFIARAKKCADKGVVEVSAKNGLVKARNAVDRAERALHMSRSSEFVAKYVASLLTSEGSSGGTTSPAVFVKTLSTAIRGSEQTFGGASLQSAPIWNAPR